MSASLSRAETILKIIVEQYLNGGAPVSSKFITEQGCLQVSSATVRNTMMQLEQSGLIRSPHTSAGRIPTTQGIRIFLDKMLQVEPLPSSWQQELQQRLVPQLPPAVLVQRAGQLLADLTGVVCFISPLKAQHRVIRQVDLIRLAVNRLLLVVVDEEGDVLHRVLTTVELDSSTLGRVLCLLNGALCGQNWPDGISRLALMLRAEQACAAPLLMEILTQLQQDSHQQTRPLVFGQHHLLQTARYLDEPGIAQVMDLLDDPQCLVEPLMLVTTDASTKLILGRESGLAELTDVSLIALRYQANPCRFLALIGPRRMNYASAIPLLEACGQLLSEYLKPETSSP